MTDTDALNRFLAGDSNRFFTTPRSNEPALAKATGSRHPTRTRLAELRRSAGSRRLLHVGFAVSLAVGVGVGLIVVLPGVRPTVPSLTAPPIAAERPGRVVAPDLAPIATGKTETAPVALMRAAPAPADEATARAAMVRWYGERGPPADHARIDSAAPYKVPHRPRPHRRVAPPPRGPDALPAASFGCPASLGAACSAPGN